MARERVGLCQAKDFLMVEAGGDEFSGLEAVQELVKAELAGALSVTIRRLMADGRLVVENGIIRPAESVVKKG